GRLHEWIVGRLPHAPRRMATNRPFRTFGLQSRRQYADSRKVIYQRTILGTEAQGAEMKFRTKIWMLPISAAMVFIVGIAISFFVGNRTSGVLKQLHEVDSPHAEQVLVIDNAAEQLRLTLQTAAAEGDIDKLKEAEAIVAKAREAVDIMAKLPEKAAIARELGDALQAYQAASIGATRALLTSQPPGDLVAGMQAAQGTLLKLLAQHKAS